MKALKFFASLLLCCSLLTSCDFFRSLFGMPTSEDLEILRKEKYAQMRVEADSAKAQEQLESEPAAVEETVAEPVEAIPQQPSSNTLDKNYYIVLGLFSVEENASRLADNLAKAGYEAIKVVQPSGGTMVVACGTDDYNEALESLEKLSVLSFVPQDIRILNRTDKR